MYLTVGLQGHPPILRLPNRQHHSLVFGRLLLLRILHRPYLRHEYRHDPSRNETGTFKDQRI